MLAGIGVVAVLAGGLALAARLTSASAGSSPRMASAMLASKGTAAGGGQAGPGAAGGWSASAAAFGVTATPAGLAGSPAGKVIARLRDCVAKARQLRAAGHLAAARATWRSCLRSYLLLRHFLLRHWLLRHHLLPHHGLLGRLLFLRHRLRLALTLSAHGQLTFMTRSGSRTIAFERGTIQATSGTSVVVKAADGTTWTWDLVGRTVVVRAWQRAHAGPLATGQLVFVAGPVVNGADDARLIVIRRWRGPA